MKIESWVSSVVDSVGARAPASDHLNQILERQVSLTDCLSAVEEAARVVDLGKYTPTLILPLGASDQLVTTGPTWARLEQALDKYEPPSLAIVSIEARKIVEEAEEYRRPMPPPPIGPIPSGQWIGYFRCFRDREALAASWEFTLAVYIEAIGPSWLG
jgi:hypothetical protein